MFQLIWRSEKCIELRSKRGSVTGWIKEHGILRSLGHLTLSSRVAGNDRETGQKVLQDLVRNCQVPALAIFHLPSETDVVLRYPRQQLCIGHQIVDHDSLAPTVWESRGQPGVETRDLISSKVDLELMPHERQCGEQILQATSGTECL